MSKKVQIFELIEAGKSNAEIAELVGASRDYVSSCRLAYNSIVDEPIRSRIQKPKEGTVSRKVYDAIVSGIVKHGDIAKVTGASGHAISVVRKRYFGYKPKASSWEVHTKTVELSELTL